MAVRFLLDDCGATVVMGRFTCGFFDRDGCIDVRFADDECHRTGQQTREQTGEEATQQQLDKTSGQDRLSARRGRPSIAQ